MSDLSSVERMKFEALFDMETGYVIDFSNNTFSAFTLENIGLDIFDNKYDYRSGSKANRLRKFWQEESNDVVGKLLSALLDYWLAKKQIGGKEISSKEQILYEECKKIANRLKRDSHGQVHKSTSSPQKGRIFISYRRADSAGYAGRIYDRLVAHFGKDAIFMDVDTIEGGVDFIKVLEDAVQSCDVLIALIGKQWLNIKDKGGKRRLENPEDFVRIEIATALKRNIRVIPVLVDGVNMPRSSELPENLKALARRHALQVNHHSFNPDIYRLIEHSELALKAAEKSKILKDQAIEKAAKEKAEKEAAEKATKEKAEKEAAEKAAREKAEREAAEKVAIEKAEKETAEKLEREKAEKAAREKAERDAAEKATKEKAEKESAKKAARDKARKESIEKEAQNKTRTKICPICGTRLADNATRCLVCGVNFSSKRNIFQTIRNFAQKRRSALLRIILFLVAFVFTFLSIFSLPSLSITSINIIYGGATFAGYVVEFVAVVIFFSGIAVGQKNFWSGLTILVIEGVAIALFPASVFLFLFFTALFVQAYINLPKSKEETPV